MARMRTPAGVLPLKVPEEIFVTDMWIMLLTTLCLLPFICLSKPITRPIGVIMVLLYTGYVVSALHPHGF